MSEVSLGFFPLPLFLYPHLLSLVHLSFSPSVSFSGWGGKSGSIADPMVWPMLYLSGQAMILSALNVIYSKRLPKSTQRDPLTQRSSLSHSHPSLTLSLSRPVTRAHSRIRTWIDTHFYARERARSPQYTRLEKKKYPTIAHTMS